MRRASIVAVLALVLPLQAVDYFPLAVGNWWRYDMYVAENGRPQLGGQLKMVISKDTALEAGMRCFIPVLHIFGLLDSEKDSSSRNIFFGDRGNDFYVLSRDFPSLQPAVKFGQHDFFCTTQDDTCLDLDSVGFYRRCGAVKTAVGELQSCMALELSDEIRYIFAPGIGLAWLDCLNDGAVHFSVRLVSYRTQYGSTPEYRSGDFSVMAEQRTSADRVEGFSSGVATADNAPVRLLIYGPEGRLLTQTTTTVAQTADLSHFLNSRTGTFLIRMLMGNTTVTRRLTIAR